MLDTATAAVIAEELHKLHPDLAAADAVLADPDASAEKQAAVLADFGRAVEGLTIAAKMISHRGLQMLAEWLDGNSEFLAALPADHRHPDVHAGLLSGWLSALHQGLTTTESPDRWKRLGYELKRPGWPDPADSGLVELLTADLKLVKEFIQPVDESTATVPKSQPPTPAPPPVPASTSGHITLNWDRTLDSRLLDAFFVETPDLVTELAAQLHALSNGQGDVAHAKRLAHTVKGSSNLVGLKVVGALSHALEDALEVVEVGKGSIDEQLARLLTETADWLETAFDALTEEGVVNDDCLRLQDELRKYGEAPLSVATASIQPEPEPLREPDVAPPVQETNEAAFTAEERQPFLRVPVKAIDELVRLAGEQIIGTGQSLGRLHNAFERTEEIAQLDNVIQQRLDELDEQVALQHLPATENALEDGFDPLEMDRYHSLHSLNNAFIEAITDARRLNSAVVDELTQLRALLEAQIQLGQSFNQSILNTRLEPASKMEQRLQRAVREAARETEKQVRLEIRGSELLLDTDVLNTLINPLVHMLRNAVDHGIESPELRTDVNKPPEGLIEIDFSREGNQFKITIQDDGGGINLEKLHRTAKRNGLLDDNTTMDEQALLRLVLNSGFSTRMQVNQLSGRGVGLDLVRQAVDDLHGSIEIDNNPGNGCRFTFLIPLTLVSVPALLVSATGRTYAIPSSSIDQLLYAEQGMAKQDGDSWSFHYKGESWPALPLARLLGDNEEYLLEKHAGRPALIVKAENNTYALLVNSALANREIVVKPLGPWLPNINGISGATILNDASVAPVLDLPRLLRQRESEIEVIPPSAIEQKKATGPARILVVDDSFSARQSLVIAVEDAGYLSISAIDGLDAIRIIGESHINMVITDLEMPRMNGFELLTHLRANSETRDLPVIVVTSRSTMKHREKAERAGADGYITKPFDNEELLQQITSLMGTAG